MIARWTPRRKLVNYLFVLSVSVCAIAAGYNSLSRKLAFGGASDTVFENEALRVDQIGSIPRLAVSYERDGDVYATEDHYIYRRAGQQKWFAELGNFDKVDVGLTEQAKDFVARLRITRDLRQNFGANNIVVLNSGTILVFYDKIYRSVDGGSSFHAVFDFKERGLHRPFNHGIAVDRNDDVYFGEYNTNPRPHKARIVKGSKDGTAWSTFYEFAPGETFHVHCVKYDPFRNLLWVCTGDRDEESALMFIDESRENLELLGAGDQGWRIVSLIPTEDALYWCSDNDQKGSNIYRYRFSTSERENLAFVGKTSYYSTRLKDGTLVFSTCFESQSPYARAQNPEPTADLWVSRNGDHWHRVLSLPGHIHETQWGRSRPTVILAGGDSSSEYLFATPRSTAEGAFTTKVLKLTWK